MICIYHKNCADGFGAAWAVRKKFGSAVKMIPASYQSTPPDVTGETVYIVDFSYKREALISMAEQAKKIIILDHHKTAEAELVDLPENVDAYFDMGRSGAMMTWDFLFGTEPPELIRYIQDRDLWRFDYPLTEPVMAAVFSHPYDFELWDQFMVEGAARQMADEGKAIMRDQTKSIHELIESTGHQLVIAGLSVPALNCPYSWASQAGNILAKDAHFSATYTIGKDSIKFSLRSTKDGLDVSTIAANYGGGGHKNAAGFIVKDFEQLLLHPSTAGYLISTEVLDL